MGRPSDPFFTRRTNRVACPNNTAAFLSSEVQIMKSPICHCVTEKVTRVSLGSQSTFLFHKRGLSIADGFSSYWLPATWEISVLLQAWTQPRGFCQQVCYNLLILIQIPIKPGLYLAGCIGSIWYCWSANAGPPSTPYETFSLDVNTRQAPLLKDVSMCLSPNIMNGI